MEAMVSREVQIERQGAFTRMASAFARRDFEAIARGVAPEVVLTLAGSSWLAGTYRGFEGFSQYLLAARMILEPAGKPLTYLHHGNEMTIMHEFLVGGGARAPEIPLHVTVQFAEDGKLLSLQIEPKDQALFDRAADAYLVPRDPHDRADSA
jgi:hypothetical protein